jgi:hypothetical protein
MQRLIQKYLRTFWVHRFRVYAILAILLCTPIIYSSNINVGKSIPAFGYKVLSNNPFFQQIEYIKPIESSTVVSSNKENSSVTSSQSKPAEVPKYKYDHTPKDLALALLNSRGSYRSGFINIQTIKDLKKPIPIPERIEEVDKRSFDELTFQNGKTLESLYPKPNPVLRQNFVSIPDYQINAPLVYAGFDDFFNKNADGTFNFDSVQELSDRFTSRLQILLKDGIVCLPFSPFPGDIGNAYCVGHSSNFADIISDYNTVLKPIEGKGNIGQIIKVWDPYGRELNFRIFNSEKIEATDTQKAYVPSPGKVRTITLQTSVVSYRVSEGWQPYERWLVRAELMCGAVPCKE